MLIPAEQVALQVRLGPSTSYGGRAPSLAKLNDPHLRTTHLSHQAVPLRMGYRQV
jgi:hypothetical protein